MSFDEKFQAGASYGNEEVKPTTMNLLADPVNFATTILKDYAGARSGVSLSDMIALLKSLKNSGEPADDRKGSTELLISILTSLPSNSPNRVSLTHKLIDTLWSDLDHPPMTYVGGDMKYEVANEDARDDELKNKYDVIEFEVPDTGVRLREEVPPALNGVHHYRMPDGSNNNILQPELGKAGSPYAKSVRNSKHLHGIRPDAGQLFDLLMARDDQSFKENAAGISSMLFYHASIIIHDIFRTSRTDMNKSDTSSYLDLAPLYGSSLRDQLAVRTMKQGTLKPDTFHEKRLLGQPAGVNVMLVLYSRFHNYVCDILLKINESGRFTLACSNDAAPEDRAKALAKQDHDLFNTARLITVAMYVEISLTDYLRGIMNTHHVNTDWRMDPRTEIGKQYDGEGVARGVGNQVSVEFNLLYRFHSCISKKDEKWINDFFLKLFPDRKASNLDDITLPELGRAFVDYEKSIPGDPSQRTFGDLERQENGRFKDEDLVRILKEAMEDPAGTFGHRMVPKALKIVEILGINQSRRWGCASLNEFREFFGLKRYEKFTDINPDKYVAETLEKLYTDPDMVELYPGLMIEDTKPVRNPGVGLCPTYTVGRAVLADAVTLVRSDRFMTIDYNASTMTAWGMNEVKGNSKTLGGSMLYKLIQRGVPGWFPFDSIAVMQPMYTKQANIKIAKKLDTSALYTLDDPKPPKMPTLVTTSAGIKQVLGNPQQFRTAWNPVLEKAFVGKRDLSWYMLSGDEPRNYEQRKRTEQAFKKLSNLNGAVEDMIDRVGTRLIEKEALKIKDGLFQIDIIRDVAIPLNAQLAADLFYFDLRTDENPDGKLSVAQLYKSLLDIRMWTVNQSDNAELWNRRRRATDGAEMIIGSTRALVDEIVKGRGLGLGVSAAFSKRLGRQAHLKKDSLRSCGFQLVGALLAQGDSAENVVDQLWLNAFGLIGVLVTTFYEIMEFFLRSEKIWEAVQRLAQKGDKSTLRKYVEEAQRLTSPLRVVRFSAQPTEVEGKQVKPGYPLVVDISGAARDPKEVDNAAEFDHNRTQPEINGFSYGQHACFGKQVALTFLTGVVKLAADLKNLRPAPGQMGIVKTIQVGHQKVYLNDSWSYFAFNANTWKVQYEGHGKGSFNAADGTHDNMEMQQYYFMMKKRKSALKEEGIN